MAARHRGLRRRRRVSWGPGDAPRAPPERREPRALRSQRFSRGRSSWPDPQARVAEGWPADTRAAHHEGAWSQVTQRVPGTPGQAAAGAQIPFPAAPGAPVVLPPHKWDAPWEGNPQPPVQKKGRRGLLTPPNAALLNLKNGHGEGAHPASDSPPAHGSLGGARPTDTVAFTFEAGWKGRRVGAASPGTDSPLSCSQKSKLRLPPHPAEQEDATKFLVLTLLSIAAILGVLLASGVIYCLRHDSHHRLREKLWGLAGDPGPDATAAYQVKGLLPSAAPPP